MVIGKPIFSVLGNLMDDNIVDVIYDVLYNEPSVSGKITFIANDIHDYIHDTVIEQIYDINGNW